MSGEGEQALWGWFELSYAAFAVMPRVLMHAMPDEWQGKMAALLQEWDEAWNFEGSGIEGTRVLVLGKNGKAIKTPPWLLQYRHPDCMMLALLGSPEAPSALKEKP